MYKGMGVIILSILALSIIAPTAIAYAQSNSSGNSFNNKSYINELLKTFDQENMKIIRTSIPGTIINNPSNTKIYREFMVVVRRDSLRELRSVVEHIKYSIPLGNTGLYMVDVIASRDQVLDIIDIDGVENIAPSPRTDEAIGIDDNRLKILRDEVKPMNRDGDGDGWGIGFFGSLRVMHIMDAWENYGVTGSGVTVGVVDTGIDYASPELGLDAIARDASGIPITATVDEHLALTPVNVVADSNGYLNTSGALIPVYSTMYSGIYGSPVIYTVNVSINYSVSQSIINMSKSSVFRFGYLAWSLVDYFTGYIYETFVPVILVDTEEPKVYDAAIFDLSTAFYELSTTIRNIEQSLYGTTYWREPDPAWHDYNFSDEPIIYYGNEIIARDFDTDGFYDFSIGSLVGTYIDTWGLADYEWDSNTSSLTLGQPGQHIGLDPDGSYVAVFTDMFGHGTSVATVIGARGNIGYTGYGGELYVYLGAAPEAKIAGATGYWFGDLIMAEYWLSGMDFTYSEGGLTPVLGARRADIISNSWSYVNLIKWLHQAPGMDILSAEINQLIITTMNQGYNVTIVFAAGNEGPGYSSVGSPGADLLAITVGASTLFEYYQIYGYSPGYADDIASFSSRGPNALGYPKPDVVAVGAFEWAGIRVNDGRGYGIPGYWESSMVGPGLTLFGGTSEATPFVSGILALGVEAYKWRFGVVPYPTTLKALLKSSCDDLNYPVLAQGSGRVNAYKLVKTILENDFVAYIRDGIARAFLEAYGNYYGEDASTISSMLYDTAYYNVALPNSYSRFTINVFGNGPIYVDAVTYVATKTITLTKSVYRFNTISFSVPHSVIRKYDYAEIYVLYRNVTWRYPYYNITPIDPRYLIRVDAFDEYQDSRYRLNTEARVSSTAVLTIGDLKHRIRGNLYIRLRGYYSPPTPVKLTLVLRLYKAVRFTWIRFIHNPVPVHGHKALYGYVRVPRYAKPGLYEFKIRIHTLSKTIIIPGTLLVPLVINSRTWFKPVFTTKSPRSYDSYTPIGLVDPYGEDVAEANDWRLIPIYINDPSVAGLLVYAKWKSGVSTSLEMFVTPPKGVINEYGFPEYLAMYKLTSRYGYVYNPSLHDQRRGLLRTYIPVKWSMIFFDTDIKYYYEAGPSDGDDIIRSATYWKASPEYLGVYRLFITFGSYSGKRLFDTVKLMFSVVRAYQYVEEIDEGVLKVTTIYRTSPIYMPFRGADTYLLNFGEDIIPYGYHRIHGVTYILDTAGGRYLTTSYHGYYVKVTTMLYYSISAYIETMLILPHEKWHSSGIIYYNNTVPRIEIKDIYYPGIVAIGTYVESDMPL